MLSGVPLLGPEVRKLLTLALPLAVAQLAQNAMGFVDTLMVGRLGPTALAGMALGATTFSTLFVILMAVLLAVSPLVAHAVGARREGEPARITRQALLMALLLSLPGMAACFATEPLLHALGLPTGAANLAGEYLRAVALGLPFALGFMALRGFYEGQGDARPILVIALGGVALNVFFNDMLVFGRYGLPALGVAGTGYATTLVYLAMFGAVALLARWRYAGAALFRGFSKVEPRIIREILRLGWPISITLGLEVGLFSVTSFVMGGFGDAVLAGHQIAMQSSSMTFMIPLGIATATAVLVGQAAGRGDPAAVRRAGLLGIKLATGFMCLSALLFWLAPRFVIGLYVDVADPVNAALIGHAVSFLAIAAMFQLVDGMQVAAAGALRGLKDTRVPMFLTLVAYWGVGLVSGLILAFGLGFGPRGLWFGLVAGLSVAALLLTSRFLRFSRRADPLAAAAAAE